MEAGTNLQIPWRLLKDKLVLLDQDTGKAKYLSTFDIKANNVNVSLRSKFSNNGIFICFNYSQFREQAPW